MFCNCKLFALLSASGNVVGAIHFRRVKTVEQTLLETVWNAISWRKLADECSQASASSENASEGSVTICGEL